MDFVIEGQRKKWRPEMTAKKQLEKQYMKVELR